MLTKLISAPISSTRELEDVFAEQGAVAHVAVIGVPKQRFGEVVGAVTIHNSPYRSMVYALVWASNMKAARKITIEVPEDLLRKAQESTGEGITQTIRRGLQLVAAGRAYEDLRRLRGLVKVSLDVRTLRDDRA